VSVSSALQISLLPSDNIFDKEILILPVGIAVVTGRLALATAAASVMASVCY